MNSMGAAYGLFRRCSVAQCRERPQLLRSNPMDLYSPMACRHDN